MPSLRPALTATLREAVRSLYGARLRTLLGLVGIMIGIASVITMISTGEIAKSQSRKQFEALGTDILSIRKSDEMPAAAGRRDSVIRLEDALALAHTLASVSVAVPRITKEGTITYLSKSLSYGSMQGVTNGFARVNKLEVVEGRFVSDMDTGRYFAVVGAEVARAMRGLGARAAIGEALDIDGRLYTVVGVLADAPETYALPFEVAANHSVFVPITTVRRIDPYAEIRLIIARTAAGVHYSAAIRDVKNFFAERSPKLALEVESAEQVIEQMESQLGLMTLLLGAVGSISLIVGGIGVMNIMLISVAERRREIGVRRALGANRGDIQRQFLIEALILTLGGGIAGVVVGTGAAYGICQFFEWGFLLSPTSIIAGVGVSSAVGLFFGFQPAYQASRLDPIVALQGD